MEDQPGNACLDACIVQIAISADAREIEDSDAQREVAMILLICKF
jgi:hypothetical protein